MKTNYLIYGYYSKKHSRIMYVGQTENINNRHKEHTVYDLKYKSKLEYNYPLSRAIRKYGLENFELQILEENLKKENLDKREIFWIDKYNTYKDGYNQTQGGNTSSWNKYSLNKIEVVKNMLINQSSFKEIKEKTGVSYPHISNINLGKRCYDMNLDYPLKKTHNGGKLTSKDIDKIKYLLNNTNLTQKEIGERFGVNQTVISRIKLNKRKCM